MTVYSRMASNLLFVYVLGFFNILINIKAENVNYDLALADKFFKDFISTYNKEYPEHEYELRFISFKESLERINKMNIESEMAVFDINQFSDRLPHETHLQRGRLPDNDVENPCEKINYKASDKALPEELDYRKEGLVTHVKNQGKCGSCYSFGAVGNIEGQYAKLHKQQLTFSEQQVVDCNPTTYGCEGGWDYAVFEYVRTAGGIESDEDYPYTAVANKCKFNKKLVKAKVTGCKHFIFDQEEDMKAALNEIGPLAIAISANEYFEAYKSGILGVSCSEGQLNHAVLLVGYGNENGVPYWIVKNSWGEKWGEKGFVRMAMGKRVCSISHAVCTAIVA